MEMYESVGQVVKNAKIKVVGVGGGGNNAVNRMIEDGISDIEFIALNTDYNVLAINKASKQIQLGQKLTRGLGAGGSAEVGRKSAEETKAEIEEAIEGADLVFITAGMGGGTGTGAAPVVAEIAKAKGILTIGVVTTPFAFEGRKRMQGALVGVANLKSIVDSLVVIPNEKLMELSDENLSFKNAFKKADDVLVQGVRGIYDIINNTSEINVDFADVCAITRDKGVAHMGVGKGSGKNKTEIAVKMAINSPLLDTSIAGAKSLLLNFVIDENTTINEVNEAVNMISDFVNPEAEIIFGCNIVSDVDDLVTVTVIATDLDDNHTMYNDGQMPQQTQQQVPPQMQQQVEPQFNQDPSTTGQFNTAQLNTSQFNTNQLNPNQFNTGQFDTTQFNTGQVGTVSYDTNPNVQPVNYDSDRVQQGQKTGKFKINNIFLQNNSILPDINK